MLRHAARGACRAAGLRSVSSSTAAFQELSTSDQSKKVGHRVSASSSICESLGSRNDSGRGSLSTAPPPVVPTPQEFLSKFAAFQGTMNEPEFPSNFIKPVEKVESASVPDKLKFNFYIPSAAINQGSAVDLVLLPATTGDFGVMPGHVPTVAELRPGVVSIHNELDKDITKYFVRCAG